MNRFNYSGYCLFDNPLYSLCVLKNILYIEKIVHREHIAHLEQTITPGAFTYLAPPEQFFMGSKSFLGRLHDAALLTRCYTQHALRPFIDSESNHIRSFIKIPFINKGIDFIDLPSIFQDKSVI